MQMNLIVPVEEFVFYDNDFKNLGQLLSEIKL